MRCFRLPHLLLLMACCCAGLSAADNSHWSRQFAKPPGSTKMTGATGMSDGNGAPSTECAKWYRGKLYMAGNWKVGVDAEDLSKRDANVAWRMWSWHPQEGYRPIVWQKQGQGGDGPDGVINDFVFLPDGRLVVVGEFLRILNLHGHSYHRANGLAVFDPTEASAERWQPLVKSVQHNAPRGGLKTIAYDPQGNDLWIGGSFAGFRMDPEHREQFCYGIQRFDLDEQRWHIMPPGLRGGTGAYKIKVDTSTKPSTIYIAGRFSFIGGDGESARDSGSARYSEGFCAWREDVGWISFPKNHVDGKIHKDGVLQPAGDFAFFDSINVFDFLVDGDDIWIVGAFSEGSTGDGKPLRGIAKWNAELQAWVDPTGKGGFGRDAYAICKTDDGKIYVAGAFGGEKGKGYYEGFKNGDPAYMVTCYDPASGSWSEMGDGLGGISMPVCRLMSVGNDVFAFGMFKQVGRDAKKDGFESYYIARWNAGVDFTSGDAPLPDVDGPHHLTIPTQDAPSVATGLEHWSRGFPPPPSRQPMTGLTGMSDGYGPPRVTAMCWQGDTLYLGGNWEVKPGERWFVWSYNKAAGWNVLAWQKGAQSEGFASIPAGMIWRDGKMYVHGASEAWKGVAIFDPAGKTWSPLLTTYMGKEIRGNGAQGNPTIHEIAWDDTTGDMYLVGACGEEIRYEDGGVPSAVLRISPDGVLHPMGKMLLPETPKHPNSIRCIYIDQSKSPSDLYIGGSFGFWGASSQHSNFAYNVAKWDHEAQDWRAMGKGDRWRIGMNDARTFPDGLPGLKAPPIYGFPTFQVELAGLVRDITMDKQGNIYAAGAVGILDDNPNINLRDEHYGIVKYDPKIDEWVGASNCRGVSRDVFQMSWLDDKRLLLSGSFLYSEDYRLLNNVAVLDTVSGALEPLAGGLHKDNDGHVIGCEVVHCLNDDGYWFGGYFNYAGIGPKARSQAPIPSNYLAHYNPTANLDPNGSLTIANIPAIAGVKGHSSENREVSLQADNIPEGGTLTWYQAQSGNRLKKLGTGASCTAKLRVSAKDSSFTFYAAVTNTEGIEGGKVPVLVEVAPAE